ncbi:MAG: peptide MFS transporter [Phycisphaerales bacterium]
MHTDTSSAPQPAYLETKTILGHPAGLFLLFMVEMWERFSFYGMRAILGLYLKCALTGMTPIPVGKVAGFNPGRGWTQEAASNLTGWYGGMAYLLPVIGGLLADKMIGTHRSMVVGGLLIALGHVVLAVSGIGELHASSMGLNVFILGLVLIVVGTGHFKPSVTVMVSQLYKPGDPRREGAFSIFYMGINVGAFLGTLVCAYLGERVGWHYGFGAAAVGMLAGLAMYLTLRAKCLAGIGLPPDGKGAVAPWFMVTGTMIAFVVAGLFASGFLKQIDQFVTNPWVLGVLVLAALSAICAFVVRQQREDRGPVLSIFIFMFFNFFFWLAFEQAATSLNFFTDEKTDRLVGGSIDAVTGAATGGFLVPAGWFQNVNPAVIVLLSPVFGWMWVTLGKRGRIPSQPIKIGLGLILLGLGYLFVTMAGMQSKDGMKAAMWLVIATYVLHTVGELFLSPTGLSYVTKAAPKKFVSQLMGIWFISSFLAYVVGGKIAGMTEAIEKGETKLPWSGVFGGQGDFFFLFVLTSCGAGLLIIALTPLLKKLMRNPTD